MIVGLGTDIVPVETMRRNMHREVYLHRVFTEQEIAECCALRHADQCFTVKFAVKEAFMKALGSGIRQGVWFTQIEVLHDCTTVRLSGHAAALYDTLGMPHIHVGASRQGVFIIALVMLEASENQENR